MKNIIEKLNKLLEKLPFQKMAEKIPDATKNKVPLLSKAIPFANLIVCGFALVLVVVIIAASGDSPKSLAKQTYKFSQESIAAMSDPKKAAKLVGKSAALEKKVNNLSAKKQEIYVQEAAKLMGGNLGGLVGNIGASGSSSSGKSKPIELKGDAIWYLHLAEKFYGKDLKFWESQVTETDAAKAPGYIAREKYNIKITGPMTQVQLKEIIGAMKNLKDEKASQLVRLDLSEVTDLVMAKGEYDNEAAFDGANLGSIVLPEGLTRIGQYAFRGCPLFEMNPIPESVKNIHSQALSSTYLSRIVLPGSAVWELGGFSSIDSYLPTTIVFSEGHEVLNLKDIGNFLAAGLWGNKQVPAITLVFPSTIKQIGCGGERSNRIYKGSDGLYEGIDTFYFYGETPPEVVTTADMFFKNIKAMYVPQNAIKAYEDAYFSLGTAAVKALPKDKDNIAYWSQPAPVDQKAVLKEYKAAAAEGKRKAQERDKELQEKMQRELKKIGF